MNVVVTGGSGLAGRHVVRDLAAKGHDVTNVDRAPPDEDVGRYRPADLRDLGQAVDSLSGADAVVHLAAIPRPGPEATETLFHTNVMTLYNVLEAAADLDIQRVVFASSISVLGFPFFIRPLAPLYVPIDEEHPLLAHDPYGLSKLVGEEMARAYTRRTGMTAISLRMPWIHTPDTFLRDLCPLWDDPAAGASNLWSYVDARDVAQACRRALEADVSGHAACFIAAANSFMKEPSAELVRRFFPRAAIAAGFEGCPSLLDSSRAERLLGYRPEHSWELYF